MLKDCKKDADFNEKYFKYFSYKKTWKFSKKLQII